MFDSNSSTPQFGTAEYVGTHSADVCEFCKQPISQQYFRVRGQMACATCAEIARQQTPVESHSAYMGALLFGIGGAVLGMIGYALLIIVLQGWTIGYMSLGVGWVVGKAMLYGSRGIGGRKYQITAAVLTYLAVSMAAVPVQISFAYKRNHSEQKQVQSNSAQPKTDQGQTQSGPAQLGTDEQSSQKPRVRMTFWEAIGRLALYGVASPFFDLADPLWGAIGLFILFIGIRIAWRMTAGRPDMDVSGPFSSPPKLA